MKQTSLEKLREGFERLKNELPDEHRRKLGIRLDPNRIENTRIDELSAIPKELAEKAAKKAGLKYHEKKTNCFTFVHVRQFFY